MSGIVNGLGSRSGVVGTTVNAKIPKGESPGGIDNYTVCMLRSDNWNNQPAGDDSDISMHSKFGGYATVGDPLHDTMGGNNPPLMHPDGHMLSSSFAMDGNDGIQFSGSHHKNDFSFYNDDYTIDYWVRLNSVTGDQYMFSFSAKSGGGYVGDGHFACNINGSNARFGPMSAAGTGYISAAHGLSSGTWYHLAYVRHGNSTYLFRDGAIIGTGTVSSQIDIVCTGSVYWGTYQGGTSYSMAGQLGEMRVSKGIARWTSPFPKPTKAYF